MAKISKPVNQWDKDIEEAIEKDVMSFNYVYFLGKKLENLKFDYELIEGQKGIAERMLDKNKVKHIKKIAKQHVNEDFKIIKRIMWCADD